MINIDLNLYEQAIKRYALENVNNMCFFGDNEDEIVTRQLFRKANNNIKIYTNNDLSDITKNNRYLEEFIKIAEVTDPKTKYNSITHTYRRTSGTVDIIIENPKENLSDISTITKSKEVTMYSTNNNIFWGDQKIYFIIFDDKYYKIKQIYENNTCYIANFNCPELTTKFIELFNKLISNGQKIEK